MSTEAISGPATNPFDTAAATAKKSPSSLSQDQFLQLLSVQFQQQDPFNPTSDTEFMAQMAQFSALEQMSELNREFSRFRSQNEFATGASLVGKEVTIQDPSGAEFRGQVDAFHTEAEGYFVEIAGALFPLSSVQGISQPAAPEEGAGE